MDQPKWHLSKSKFVAGIQCLKRLYLEVHAPDLAEDLDEATEAILSQGQEVGLLAQRAFPGGVAVQSGHDELDKALARTQELIAAKCQAGASRTLHFVNRVRFWTCVVRRHSFTARRRMSRTS